MEPLKYFVDAHRDETRPLITSFFAIGDINLDPDECTRLVGLNPTTTSQAIPKGFLPNGKVRIKDATWSIRFDKEPVWGIDEGLHRILDILWPQRDRVVEFLGTTGFSALFGTNVTIHASRPLYSLSPKTIRRMSFFGLEYLFDIFDYSE
jgi:hypothetical protein